MSEHTPGPWSVEDHHAEGWLSVGGPDNSVDLICDLLGWQVAEGQTTPLAVAMANARLIAAAPDLLAALKMVAATVEAGEELTWGQRQQVLGAIGRAEGRS